MNFTPKQLEARKIVAEGNFLPGLVREDDGWHARWIPCRGESAATGADLERGKSAATDADAGEDAALALWVDEFVRRASMTRLSADAEDDAHNTIHDAWLAALRSRSGLVRREDGECAAFAATLKAWHAAAFIDREARAKITFNFTAGGDGFAITCAAPVTRRGLRALGESIAVFGPLRGLRADATCAGANGADANMRTRGSASLPKSDGRSAGAKSRTTGTVAGAGESAAEAPRLKLPLSKAEAESFIRSGADALRGAGYRVEGVAARARVSGELAITDAGANAAAGESAGATGAGDAAHGAFNARLKIVIEGEEVDAAEIRFLLEQESSLVFFREHWIEIDRAELRNALRALEKQGDKVLPAAAAMRFAMGIGAVGGLEIERVRTHGWLRGLINELRARAAAQGADAGAAEAPRGAEASEGAEATGAGAALIKPRTKIPGLATELRPYQARGVEWMRFLTENGFGALLADDMGLGKTVQTIAWLITLAKRPALIVAPLTLLANWKHEIARFAPSINVYVHQGSERQLLRGFERMTAGADVVVTSYTLLVRDYSIIRRTDWEALVLDEAQAIKNPDTQVARAVRSLGARRRVALTGTPIENSVADMWSLEEYLNPTFLGDRKSFAERFVKPIAASEQSNAGRRLRHALEPFVLRRLKSDGEIAGELGEKREIKEYCVLAPEQRREYEAALEDYRATERHQGDIFALITRLKLVCDGAGKFERLYELLEAIFAAGESALVFTQYAKIGAQLRAALAKRFGRRFPYLYGGLSARAREQEIALFTEAAEPTAFVLSLRAGGFGLNLTKATHVIHFDRWWNPAVENQATDRAHRIGQTKTVFVHSFITEGTLEEHVDEILERKSRVAGSLVQSGESFLAQLTAEEIEEAVKLDV